MQKVPVGASIAHGYSFGFKNFFTLLKLMWLPLAIMMGCYYFFMSSLTAIMQPAQNSGGAWLLILPLYAVMLIMVFAQFVAIARHALGLDPEPGWFSFPLGKPLWRLVGAFALVLLIVVVAAIVLGLLVGIITAAMTAMAKSGSAIFAGLLTGISMLFVYGVLLYGTVRLMFLLTPVVVAESRIGVGRTWTLGGGNFWRMFIILIALFLPLLVVEIVALKFLPGIPPIQPGAPEQTRAAILAWEISLLGRVNTYWYIIYPCFALVMVLFYGMLISAQCFAYRALVPAQTEADAFS